LTGESSWKNVFLTHTLKGVVAVAQLNTFNTIENLIEEKVLADLKGIFLII